MKSVAIYARVSSEQQAQQATIESQVAALKERVAADGHVLLPQDEYLDDGFSGSTLVRPALERVRDRVAEGAVDRLYVHSPDRLARKYAYQVLLLDELRKQGVAVVFLNGPAGKTPEDELLVQVQGMIAEYERAKILERSRRGKIHRARQGEVSPLGSAPYGFAYVKKSDGSPASYRVLLHEAKVVRDIFHAFVHEQKTLSDIARELSARDVPTRRGAARWGRPTVWTILRNPAHMGRAAFGKSEAAAVPRLLRPRRASSSTPHRATGPRKRTCSDQWIWIDVPAIVSREVFEAAQAQLERNKRLAQRNARGARYLLQGLTVCGRCGYAFSGRSAKGRAYYYCQGAHYCGGQPRVCQNPSVGGQQLDDYVWRSVSWLLQDPARMLDEWTRRQQGDGMTAELQQQRDDAARALAAQERSLKRLVDAYEIGAIEIDDLKGRSEAVRARVQRARRDLANAEHRLRNAVHLREVVARLDDFAARVRQGLDTLSWLERRTIIRTLVAKIEIDETGATVVYRLPSAQRAPAPSDTDPQSEATSGGGNGASCRLRSQRERFVTGAWARGSRGSAWPWDRLWASYPRATNRDDSFFRPDFRARFGRSVRIPPLRERREDIPLLVRHWLLRRAQQYADAGRFLRVGASGAMEPRISGRLIDFLVRQPLPLNVRELNAILLKALDASADDEVKLPSSLPSWNTNPPPEDAEAEGVAKRRAVRPPSKEELHFGRRVPLPK